MSEDDETPRRAAEGLLEDNRARYVSGRIIRTWRDLWEPVKAQAHRECQDRRRRVLSHHDLAEQLTQPPLSYKRADQWNGFVPPKLLPEDACPRCGYECRREHTARVNTSPRRRALVAISAEAYRRDRGEEASGD